MKLATFVKPGATAPQVGVVIGESVVGPPAGGPYETLSMLELIARWDDLRAEVEGWAQAGTPIPLAEVDLLAPIPRPGKILCMGLNYADHVAETGRTPPEHQVWFCKQPTAAHGPYAPIELPRASAFVDYEVELVAVIGVTGRHIGRDAAPGAVFGYCVGNDVSARDWQRKTPQWMLGKSFDTHGPFGPWITTADEIADPHALDIRCLVNGEVRQSSNTRHLIFDVFDQIAEVSEAMTLEPGDIIYTGTPGGVGVAMKPPSNLKPGDRVTCEIEGLGRIDAEMVPEA